ncbi:pirin-like C-terminal cupin domain-containing protein [Streptomyces sp. C10-9-1]|uniref:pirin-like C-terminal cupin domain-containing protein n=1 Tax=Streptomyces sp. C10-9-1 TaxID=1859285 RepID=UPI003D748CFB
MRTRPTDTAAHRSVAAVLPSARAPLDSGLPVRRAALPGTRTGPSAAFLTVEQIGPGIPSCPPPPDGPPAAARPSCPGGDGSFAYVLDGGLLRPGGSGPRRSVPPGAVVLRCGDAAEPFGTPLAAPGGLHHQLRVLRGPNAGPPGDGPASLRPGPAPVVRRLDGTWFRVLAGRACGAAGPLDAGAGVTAVHVSLAPGAAAELPAPARHLAAVYVLAGDGRVAGREVGEGELAVLAEGGAAVRMAGGPVGADLLLLSARPGG